MDKTTFKGKKKAEIRVKSYIFIFRSRFKIGLKVAGFVVFEVDGREIYPEVQKCFHQDLPYL